MNVFDHLIGAREKKGGGFLLLLDPDRTPVERMEFLAENAAGYDVDALLVGTSYVIESDFHHAVKRIKEKASVPIIIFPGVHSQIAPDADAVLFTSLISGRNPQYLIEEQVRGAPLVKQYNIETIPTGYMLIDSRGYTSVQFASRTFPIPSDKPDIACAHALAAQYLGMRMIFMEAGSGAIDSVPETMIRQVADYMELPIMVGGGINDPAQVERKILAGASFVVVGNHFENKENFARLRDFTRAAHPYQRVEV